MGNSKIRKEIDVVVSAKGTETTKGKLGGVEQSIGGITKSLLAGAATFYTFKKAIDFTTGASIKQEEIFRKLRFTTELTGKNWKEAKGELDNLFSSLQDTTKYGDTQSADMLQRLIQLSSNYERSVHALPLALDLASSGLFDFESAGRMLGMALAGNIEMLGRYIPELKVTNNQLLKTMATTEKVDYAIGILQKKFGGMAKNELKSTSGEFQRLNNYLGDIGETIGDITLPAINDLLTGITSAIQNLGELRQTAPFKEILDLWGKIRKQKFEIETKRIEDLENILKRGVGFTYEYTKAGEKWFEQWDKNNKKAAETSSSIVSDMAQKKRLEELNKKIQDEALEQWERQLEKYEQEDAALQIRSERAKSIHDATIAMWAEYAAAQEKAIEKNEELSDSYIVGQAMGSRFTGFISSAIMNMANSNKDAFEQIEAAFKNMLTRMVAEYLAKSFVFGIASMFGGGFGLGLTGGLPFTRFVFGQHGADFVTREPTLIMAGEGGKREHVKIQPAPINNTNSNLTINMYGTYYQNVDQLAEEIANRSNLGFNRINVNS